MMKGGESPQPTHKQHLPFNYAQQQNKNLEMFFFLSLITSHHLSLLLLLLLEAGCVYYSYKQTNHIV
jgi:hypothetical protein